MRVVPLLQRRRTWKSLIEQSGARYHEPTLGEIIRLTAPYDPVYIICADQRIGFRVTMAELEYTHFDPANKPLNQQFQMAAINWPDESLGWWILVIPYRYIGKAREIAWKHGLRLLPGQAPAILANGRERPFPIAPLVPKHKLYSVEYREDNPNYALHERDLAELVGADEDGARALQAAYDDEQRQVLALIHDYKISHGLPTDEA